jgi:hypothetical protein
MRHVLDEPGFEWQRDGEALLRRSKPEAFRRPPLPSLLPMSEELADGLRFLRASAAASRGEKRPAKPAAGRGVKRKKKGRR